MYFEVMNQSCKMFLSIQQPFENTKTLGEHINIAVWKNVYIL